MAEFYDLHASGGLEEAKELGWSHPARTHVVAKPSVQQEARKVRLEADVVIATGDSKVNRIASDCWEVDMIGSPEMHEEKDFMHQMNSGLDYVIARECAEKGIAAEFDFSNVLASHGRKRAQVMARMAQNVRICRDAHCDMVITSGAKDGYGLRSPRDLMAFGMVLGMAFEEARDAVSLNPGKILQRTRDRRDPDIILKGLSVKRWGSKSKEKKIYGWY